MDTDLTAIKAALAEIGDTELASFRALAADLSPVPALLVPDDRRSCEECLNLDRQRGRDRSGVVRRRVVANGSAIRGRTTPRFWTGPSNASATYPAPMIPTDDRAGSGGRI